jgi:hypothetical protein
MIILVDLMLQQGSTIGRTVVPHAAGGPTSEANGQGLCERCNCAKQAPGWNTRTAPPGQPQRHTVITTTPTGHTYTGVAPRLTG